MGSAAPRPAEHGTDWRLLDGVATAWFEAPSLIEGAALAGRVGQLPVEPVVDVRATGVRVRLESAEHAGAVSAAARDLGLTPRPGALQQLTVVLESGDPSAVRPFWRRALGYAPDGRGGLADPWRRDPALRIRLSDEPRPLRHRIHLDVVRPAAEVEAAGLGEASGPYGVRHADPDGNEVDLVPGERLGDDATADWQAVFGAMAWYRVSSPTQQRAVVAAAAAVAGDAGFPLLVDARPGLVVVDSGKDQWEDDAHGLAVRFTDLAAQVQAAARELGATADARLPRFTQVFLDAADVAAVRAFWAAVLGYVPDRRAGVPDLVDPHRLGPVLAFQELDASDTGRRRQRNRIHLELSVPEDAVQERLATALAAGGRVLDASGERRRVADPEGNELVLLGEG